MSTSLHSLQIKFKQLCLFFFLIILFLQTVKVKQIVSYSYRVCYLDYNSTWCVYVCLCLCVKQKKNMHMKAVKYQNSECKVEQSAGFLSSSLSSGYLPMKWTIRRNYGPCLVPILTPDGTLGKKLASQ